MRKAEWFAGRLRELREAANLTQQQLAERSGMTVRTITQLECGGSRPSWETVLALAEVLQVELEEFAREPADQAPRSRGRPPKMVAEAAPADKRHGGRRQVGN
jgi:transcriptional regulator with XRE-family HTH domain